MMKGLCQYEPDNGASITFMRALKFISLLFLCQISLTAPALCWDRPFNNAANWGGTGLMEIPTARVLEDGVIRFGYAQANPFRWYTGAMGLFPGLEFSGRYTDITNIPSGLGSGFGSNKDKAFDLKYQILPESKRFPALAIGLNDIIGTKLFEAQYLALSRQIFPFDFTIGIGCGRLKGPFGGIEWALTERFHVLAEYNPIKYEKDEPSARGVPEGAKSPINVGMRMKVLPGLDVGVSYQRGDTLSFMVHLQTKLGEPIIPKRPDPPLRVSVDRRPLRERDVKVMVEKIHEAIHEAGFKDVLVYTDGIELTAEFENDKYLSNQKAVGRGLRILLFHSPGEMKKLTVILKRRRMAILSISVKPDHLEKYLLGKIPEKIFRKLIEVKTVSAGSVTEQEGFVKAGDKEKVDFQFGIKPDIDFYLNDPSGVFKSRVGIQPFMIASLWEGASGLASYKIPFYSNISSSNIPPEDAVRSDSFLYLDRDYSFDRLMLDQAVRLSERTFGRLTGGYLEYMYAGVGGEILTFLGEGNLALGIEGDWVRKREPGTQLALMDFDSYTLLGNAYYTIPGIDTTLHAQYGRFLAGDIGWRFEVSRKYNTGAILGFWYSYTDTDDLVGFNKGYHDKGVFLSLPAQMFLNRETRMRYDYYIAPWTRDVAATVYHWQDLFRLEADLMPANFKNELSKIKE